MLCIGELGVVALFCGELGLQDVRGVWLEFCVLRVLCVSCVLCVVCVVCV